MFTQGQNLDANIWPYILQYSQLNTAKFIRSLDKLIFKAYREEIENDKADLTNWVTYVMQTLNTCGISQTWNEQASVNENNVYKIVKNKLRKFYEVSFFLSY